jgi:hypothetical protein
MVRPDKGGTMKTHKLIPILLALPLAVASLACPTRVGPAEDGTGGSSSGGRGGASATDTGTGGTTGLAGAGETGVAGAGGTAGLTGADGAAGETGTGGVAGATGTGGAAGATGTGGVAGATGTGGTLETCSPACSSSTQTCVGTKCMLNDGQPCGVASQCVSNACTPFYVDQDGDGYGTGQAAGFCGTMPPVGYAAQTGDCCDTATNIAVAKLIHPGASYQTTSAGGVCNITWDYNCSGTVEVQPESVMGTCASSATYPTCATDSVPFPATDCGMAIHTSACVAVSDNTCSVEGGPATLGCR